MKEFLKKIADFFKNLFKVIGEVEIEEPIVEAPEEIPEVVDKIEIDLEPIEEPKVEEPINIQEEEKQVVEEPKTTEKEIYIMLNLKKQQTYLKKIGLYSKKVDGIKGSGHKKAIKHFNIIFLNKKSEEYTEETDKLLREFYNAYMADAYMTESDWKFFKKLKKSEYKCKCGGKYCDGHPHKIHKRLVMQDQYARNVYGKPLYLTSGLRCTKHNKNSGGVAKSKHLYGRGSDKYIKGVKASDLRKTINELEFVNYSYDVTSSVVHSDVKI